MGGNRGGDIFNPVARSLITAGANAIVTRDVLGQLLDALRAEDWVTCEETIHEFADQPLIVALFHQRGIGNKAYGAETDGILGFDGSQQRWLLLCDGPEGCGEIERAPDDSTDEHDRLVRRWSRHDQERHGGDGIVDDSLFLVQPA